jgi:hypothetical protein
VIYKNVGKNLCNDTLSHPRRFESSKITVKIIIAHNTHIVFSCVQMVFVQLDSKTDITHISQRINER